MKKLTIITAIWALALCGCQQNTVTSSKTLTVEITATFTPAILPSLIPTETPKATITETPIPTLVYYLFPSITPDPKKTPRTPYPTITAPATRFSKEILPGDLGIEEYKIDPEETESIASLVSFRHPNKGGWYFWPKGGMIDGKLFQAAGKTVPNKPVEIRATLDGDEIFVIECGQITPLPTVITAWTYDNHWIIQSVCHQEFDIFWDGISLNNSKGYQSSFAFQLIDKKPFYLFKRNEQVWLFYEGKEVLLGYDEVKLTYCCMSFRPPQHYENMITFYATKNEQLYYVAIGLFEE